MDKRKTPLSFNIIYWIMNVITGLYILVFIGAIVMNVLLYTDFFGNDLQLHVDLPGKVNFLEKGILPIGGTDIKIELVEASSRIHFFNTPLFLAQKFGLVLLGVLVIGFILLWTFRQFVANVKNGNIFTIDNIYRLQRMSYALVAFWAVMIIYPRITYYFVTARLKLENIEVMSDFNSYAGILLAALFIWVLSHIFIKGLKLQEEQDLTV